MKHFNTITLALLFLIISIGAQAQPGDRVEQLRIAFLTEELDLTVQEGQTFWPLFNEFSDKRKDQDQEVKRAERDLDMKDSPSESDVMEVAQMEAESLRSQADLMENYLPKFMEILGPERTVRLMRSEEKFKRLMLERIRDRRRP